MTIRLLTLGIPYPMDEVTWLFRDEFTTGQAAPLGSPRNAEPGPGRSTLIQIDGQFSISGEKLQIPAQSSPTWGDLGFYSGPFNRIMGRALFGLVNFSVITVAGGSLLGWGPNANLLITDSPAFNFSNILSGGTFGFWTGIVNIPLPFPVVSSTDMLYVSVLRSNGSLSLCKVNNSWKLHWISYVGSDTVVYLKFLNHSNVGTLDYLHVRDLVAPYNTDYGLATLYITQPTNATEYVGNADGITDLTVTAPGVLDGLTTTRCGFYYRADADNSPAWHCYVDGLGAFRLDSIASDGTRTNRINVAGVIAGGQTRTLRSIHDAALHDCYTLASTTWTKCGTQINVSLNDAVPTIEPSIPAGWTATNLVDWPRTLTAAQSAELDRT